MNEALGAVQTRPIVGDHRLAGTVPPLGHRAESAPGCHRGEEAADDPEFPLYDERDEVVRKLVADGGCRVGRLVGGCVAEVAGVSRRRFGSVQLTDPEHVGG
jgi:hypothetical protein